MKILDNEDRLVSMFEDRDIAIIDNVVLFGQSLVHPDMLDAFEHMLKAERNHDLKAIFICPDGPLDKLGEYEDWTRSFCLSLPRILSYTIETEPNRDGLSLTAGVWLNMIHTFLHELRHNINMNPKMVISAAPKTPEMEEELEEDARLFADLELERLAAKGMIEMPALAEIPWFNTHVMQLLVNEIQAGEKEWAGAHKQLIDRGVVFEKDDESYTSIREYFKATSQQPDIYEDRMEPVQLQMIAEKEVSKPTNVFDTEVLPGEQMGLFQKPILEGANPETVIVPQEAPKGESMDVEELEMLDSIDKMEEGDPIVDDVADCTVETTVSSVQTPAPAAPAPSATPAPVVGADKSMAALAMCMDVYARLVEHMFIVSGHVANGTFLNAGAVCTVPMPLSGAEIESGLFASSYTVDVTSMSAVWDDCRKAGGIRGRTFKNGTLPGYDLMINWFGTIRRVRLVAQNPNKDSMVAAKARAGVKIVWLIDQDAPTGQGFVGCFENGVYTPCKR